MSPEFVVIQPVLTDSPQSLVTKEAEQSHTPLPVLKVGPSLNAYFSLSQTQFVLTAAHFALLPTPSPELAHAPAHHHHSSHEQPFIPNNQIPSWDVQSSIPTGSKRAHDYNVDDFFSDMKKRRVNPSYDPR